MRSQDLNNHLNLSVKELHQLLVDKEEKEIKENEKRNSDIEKFKESILKQTYWKIKHHIGSIMYVQVLNTSLDCLSVSITQRENIAYTIENRKLNLLWFDVKHLYPYQHCLNICISIDKKEFDLVLSLKDNISSYLK